MCVSHCGSLYNCIFKKAGLEKNIYSWDIKKNKVLKNMYLVKIDICI
jgi:hypothetical protein